MRTSEEAVGPNAVSVPQMAVKSAFSPFARERVQGASTRRLAVRLRRTARQATDSDSSPVGGPGGLVVILLRQRLNSRIGLQISLETGFRSGIYAFMLGKGTRRRRPESFR